MLPPKFELVRLSFYLFSSLALIFWKGFFPPRRNINIAKIFFFFYLYFTLSKHPNSVMKMGGMAPVPATPAAAGVRLW
jgi:hypothetical protein